MDLGVRPDFFEREVRLAIENGCQQVDTFSGSGYLLPSNKRIPKPKYMVWYEIVILLNPTEKRAAALGYMVGNRIAFERAMKADVAKLNYSPGKMWDIRIKSVQADTATFSVLTRMESKTPGSCYRPAPLVLRRWPAELAERPPPISFHDASAVVFLRSVPARASAQQLDRSLKTVKRRCDGLALRGLSWHGLARAIERGLANMKIQAARR